MIINPFEDRFVTQPRKVSASVPGLNDAVLETLLDRVSQASQGETPRPVQALPAILVTSPEPGCGKSHLIGRFFSKLCTKATRIYVQPFSDEDSAWTAILQQTIQEMTYPDDSKADYCRAGENNQLDSFANGVLAHLVAASIRAAYPQDDRYEQFLKQLVAAPVEVMNLGSKESELRTWLEADFDGFVSFANGYLQEVGVRLSSGHQIKTWLRVLYHYAKSSQDPEARELCLEWLKVKSTYEDAADLNIRRNDCESSDVSARERNEKCHHHLVDLCALASFYRPFVFCFDQTETYGLRPELAKAFGGIIGQLFNEASNQVTVVTVNMDVWKARLEPNIELADRNRIGSPSALRFLTKANARKLTELRLEAFRQSPEEITQFNDEDWIDGLFQGGGMSVRRFLAACSQRFVTNRPKPEPTLEEFFQTERQKVLTSARRMAYSPEILRWFIERVPERVMVERTDDPRFEAKWNLRGDRQIHFCLEEGCHHSRWRSIADKAMALKDRQGFYKCLALRTSEQDSVPKNWPLVAPIIEEAQDSCLEIRVLSRDETAEIYAAWGVYALACQGDIAGDIETVFAFCRERLRDLGRSLVAPLSPPPKPKPDPDLQSLSEEIEQVVNSVRFIGYDQLQEQVEADLTLALAVKACGFSSKIDIVSHPNNTVFLWKP